MPATEIQDERSFENAVDLTLEQEAANKAYFEGKGVSFEIESTDDKEVGKTTTPDAKGKDVVDPAAPAVTVPPVTTPEGTTIAAGVDDPEIDPETRAEWQAAKNDGERLGYNARRTKKIRELEAAATEAARKVAELEGRIAGMAQVIPPPAQSTLVSAAPAQPKVETPAPEAPKTREFSEPKPVRPKIEDFQDQDDPMVAWQSADNDYLDKRDAWKDRKTEFDTTEKKRIETEINVDKELRSQFDAKLERGRAAHADFNARTSATDYGPMLSGVLMFNVRDGEELAYQLTSPEYQEDLLRLRAMTDPRVIGNDPGSPQYHAARDQVIETLAEFRLKVKGLLHPAAPKTDIVTPPATAQPAAAAVVTAPPVPAVAAPSNPPVPRRQDPTPVPVNGVNAAPGLRYEDIDPEDYDARKAWRKAHGLA